MTPYLRDFAIWLLFFMLPMSGAILLAYICLTIPARRNERARLFIDLLETGLRAGQSPERTIVAISDTRDRSVSVHFHLLAAHIDEGARLEQALDLSPRFLPRSIAEVIKIGARENQLAKLLPAARAMLTDVTSRLSGALNYVVVFAVVVVPGMFFVLPAISIFIWPKLKQILIDMEAPPPAFTSMVFENYGLATAMQMIFLGVILFFGLMYVAGPRLQRWARNAFGGLPDWLALWLPWRRSRAHRDFTAVLAILLDAGMREPHAVKLAAQATGNDVFESRADRVLAELNEGVALPEALAKVERSREFQWRLANALRTGKDFFAALRGWHESLETRAFQQEQAAAHMITTSMVIINGLIVGAIACSLFLIFVSLIEEGALW